MLPPAVRRSLNPRPKTCTKRLKRIARISCAGDASWAADIWGEADRRLSLLVCVHCLGWLIEDHESIAPMVSLLVCITY